MWLDLACLHEQLNDSPIGHTIDYYHKIPSTMPIAHQVARRSETRTGVLVVAEEQTAGRGRLQRSWTAPPGEALLLSVIVKPPLPFPASQLPMAVGVAVMDALENFAPVLRGKVSLKWPNDVLLGDRMETMQKVAGVLIETSFEGGSLVYAIIGVGINVNQNKSAFPAPELGAPPPTSLCLHLQQTSGLDRTALLISVCRSLNQWLFLPSMSGDVFDVWKERLCTLGQAVTVFEAGEQICRGLALDVSDDGRLVVVDETGVCHYFAAGDVSLRQV